MFLSTGAKASDRSGLALNSMSADPFLNFTSTHSFVRQPQKRNKEFMITCINAMNALKLAKLPSMAIIEGLPVAPQYFRYGKSAWFTGVPE